MSSANLNRFLIVKVGSLGDIVHCLPSVAQLRRAFPRAEIDWLIERKNRTAVELSGLDVRIVEIDTYQWRNSPSIGSAREIAEFVWALRTDGYDCAIDFQGLLKSAFFAYLSGAPMRIGWERDFLKESVGRIFYTEVVKPKRIHIIVVAGSGILQLVKVFVQHCDDPGCGGFLVSIFRLANNDCWNTAYERKRCQQILRLCSLAVVDFALQ